MIFPDISLSFRSVKVLYETLLFRRVSTRPRTLPVQHSIGLGAAIDRALLSWDEASVGRQRLLGIAGYFRQRSIIDATPTTPK